MDFLRQELGGRKCTMFDKVQMAPLMAIDNHEYAIISLFMKAHKWHALR